MISGDDYGILQRLLLNEKLEPTPEGLLRMLGFVHVYTASGLHLIALENFLQRFFGRTLYARKILTVLFWVFLIVVWQVQGFRLGFARVLLLFFLRALARVRGYRWRVFYPLFVAFCFDSALGIQSGWQHYYLAVLGGMLGLELARRRGVFVQHLYLSVCSWLMTAPLDLWEHHEIAWMTPVWSMLTIPPIAVCLYPLSVLSYFILGRVPSLLIEVWNTGVHAALWVVDHGFTFSVIDGRLMWGSLFVAILTATAWRRVRQRYLRMMIVIGGLLLVSLIPRNERLALVQLDVGQGDALLVHRRDRVEMIDLGTSRGLHPETMVHRLAAHGLTRVDTVLLSHLDEDHAGGLRLLLPWVPVSFVQVDPQLERSSLVRSWLQDFPTTSFCSSGCFQLGKVGSVEDFSDHSGNARMATAIIPLSDQEVYLALGDAGVRQEKMFWQRHHSEVERYPRRLLKVSHHGSKHSSSPEFLRAVNPVLAVISAGRRNRYHHPHVSVLQHLIKDHIPIHRTDRDGDFVWRSAQP